MPGAPQELVANPLIHSNLESVGQRLSFAALFVPMAQTWLWNELGVGPRLLSQSFWALPRP